MRGAKATSSTLVATNLYAFSNFMNMLSRRSSMFIESMTATVKTFMMFSATNERTLMLLVLFDVAEVGYYYARTIHRLISCLSSEIDKRALQTKAVLSTCRETRSGRCDSLEVLNMQLDDTQLNGTQCNYTSAVYSSMIRIEILP